MAEFNGIKAGGKTYEIWATKSQVQALNNTGNAGLATELQTGKTAIANAITAKGGTAQPTQSLAELATDVADIPNYSAFAKLAAVLMEPVATDATMGIVKTNKLETADITDPFGLCESFRERSFQYMLITSVSLPNVTSVGEYAFGSCGALQSVSLPNVTSVGAYAFNGCGALQSVSLPNVTSVGAYAFRSCGALQSVEFPNVTSVGDSAFGSCGDLQSVEFGKLLSFGPTNTFRYCYILAKITIGAGTDINLNFSTWSPSSLPARENEQFNIDFVEGIINNLYDYSTGTAHTLTLSANVMGRLTADTIALANAKGWNIA